jgi:DNA-binding CsgD family transcriptional regulator
VIPSLVNTLPRCHSTVRGLMNSWARISWLEWPSLHEATGRYDGLQAAWDIRRADSRVRPFGIRRGVRGRRGPRTTSGWDALTPTEVRIAAMVAGGAATPEIARGMFLSRRTVQTHVSHILAKLGAKDRVDIVREALRQGISA